MKKMLGVGAVALVMALVMVGSASAHKVIFSTSLEVQVVSEEQIDGDVDSSKGKCVRNRKIKVFHVDEGTAAPQPAGVTVTNGIGNFTIDPTVTPDQDDEWIVKLIKKILKKTRRPRHRHMCPPLKVQLDAFGPPPAP